MRYTERRFSVGGYTPEYAAGHERTFGKKARKPLRCDSCGHLRHQSGRCHAKRCECLVHDDDAAPF